MSDKTRKNRECTIDKQNIDKNYNVKSVNSIDILKECVLKIIDNISKDFKYDLVGLYYFSVKLNLKDSYLETDTDICYLRLETDLEYENRLRFEDKADQNAFQAIKIQAKRLGYRLEKISE